MAAFFQSAPSSSRTIVVPKLTSGHDSWIPVGMASATIVIHRNSICAVSLCEREWLPPSALAKFEPRDGMSGPRAAESSAADVFWELLNAVSSPREPHASRKT